VNVVGLLRYIAKRILNQQRIESRYEREEGLREEEGTENTESKNEPFKYGVLGEKAPPDTIGREIYHPENKTLPRRKEKTKLGNHKLCSCNYFIEFGSSFNLPMVLFPKTARTPLLFNLLVPFNTIIYKW